MVATVAPIGLRDHERGEVTFTTSLGLGKKARADPRQPRVSLAYHAREHGFATDPRFVLVQGRRASTPRPISRCSARSYGRPRPDSWARRRQASSGTVTCASTRRPRPGHGRGRAGDRLARPALRRPSPRSAARSSRPRHPQPQAPPKKGTGPRVELGSAAKRLRPCPTSCSHFPAPTVSRWSSRWRPAEAGERGVALQAAEGVLPEGARRAGLLGHRFNAKLIGLESRQHTGWLEVDAEGQSTRPTPRPASAPRPARRCSCSATA